MALLRSLPCACSAPYGEAGDLLTEIDGDIDGEALLSLAVRFGGTRLIDNRVLAS